MNINETSFSTRNYNVEYRPGMAKETRLGCLVHIVQ